MQVNQLLEKYRSDPNKEYFLATNRERIDTCFTHETMEEIVASLIKAMEHDDFARGTLLFKSPTSSKVALSQLQKGGGLTLRDSFEMELKLGVYFKHSDNLYEGVPAVLVDEDHKTTWNPRTLADISEYKVESLFVHKIRLFDVD